MNNQSKLMNLVRRESRFDKKMRALAQAYRSSKSATLASVLAAFAVVTLVAVPAVFLGSSQASETHLSCTLYGVQDEGGSDSQFFKLDIDTNTSTTFGGDHDSYDIEGFDFHPTTDVLYAISGNGGGNDGNVYTVNTTSGDLTLIGNTGITNEEIVSASFHPDGTLWAFQENEGLVTIDLSNGSGTLEWEVDGPKVDDNWEGLAWDLNGNYLYGSDGGQLFKYDPTSNSASRICTNLPKPTEALEFRYDGVLIGAQHGDNALYEIYPDTCGISSTGYNLGSFDDMESLTFLCEEIVVDVCEANDAPVAVIDPTDVWMEVGETVMFDASSSHDPNADDLEFSWHILGDDQVFLGETFDFTPNTPGQYTLTMTAYDECDNTKVTTTINVTEEPVDPPTGELCYLIADKGGSNGGDDLLTQINLADSNPATNETNVGTGTGTTYAESIAIHPITGTIYSVDAGQLGTLDPVTGKFTARTATIGSGNGSDGNKSFADIDGLIFDPFTSELYATVRTSDADLLIKVDHATGAAVSGAFEGNDYAVISPTAGLEDIDDIAIDPATGVMYATANNGGSGDHLVTVDTTTGATTNVGSLGMNSVEGLTFTNDGILVGVHGDGNKSVFDIDPSTAAISNIRPIDNASDYEGIACHVEERDACVGNTAPEALINDVDDVITESETIEFNASGSTDADGDELTYEWLVNGTVVSTDETFVFDPASTGEYTIVLMVSDGCSSDTTSTVVDVIDEGMCYIELTKIDDVESVYAGESITYTITFENTGTADCTGGGVTLRETYDERTTFVSSDPVPVSGDNEWNFGTVEPGETHTVTVTVVTDGDIEAGDPDIYNEVCVWAAEFGSKHDDVWVCADEDTPIVSPPDQCLDNAAPTADAGDDVTVVPGTTITLDGTGSTDPENDELTYAWSIPSLGLDFDTATADVTFNNTGAFEAFLTVNDSCTPDTDSMIVTVKSADPCTGNNAPIAVLEPESPTILLGETVSFSGANSTDSDGDDLTYEWLVDGASVATTETFDYTPGAAGDSTITLVVSDQCTSVEAETTVTTGVPLCEEHTDPVAVINPTEPVIEFGDTVNFDASGSTDADGDDLTYEWKVDGVVVSTDETFDFTPMDDGTYTVTLTVTDVCGSHTVETTVQVNPRVVSCQGNTAPIAVAGNDIKISQGDHITLDGSGSSDADGDELTYSWFISDVEFSYDGVTANPQFNQSGTYTVTLTVSDGCAEATDELILTSTPTTPGGCQENCGGGGQCVADTAPTADAGSDIIVNVGQSFTLDASNSFDPDSAPTYKWSIVAVGFTSTEKVTSTSIGTAGTYTATLEVRDACSVDVDELQITVNGGGGGGNICIFNDAPVAYAGEDVTVNVGEPIILDASGSFDPNNNTLQYQWEVLGVGFTSGEEQASLIIDTVGVYTARLTVRDQCSLDTDELQIRVTQVLGDNDFVPPTTTPRAGAGIPTANFIYGALSGLMAVGTGMFRSRRPRSKHADLPNFVN